MENREPLRVMAIRGVGKDRGDGGWQLTWREALTHGIHRWDPQLSIEFEFVRYDDLFDATFDDGASLMSRLWLILGSDAFRWIARPRRSRRSRSVGDELRWTAGMVVQWMSSEGLRRRSRERLVGHLNEFRPHVLFAHSLGSLISYDALAREPLMAARRMTLVTFGSQIGNRCVQNRFPGNQIKELPVRRWFHLYNRHDDIFTTRVCLNANSFREIDTPFDLPGLGDHAAVTYLSHAVVAEHVWRPLLEPNRLRRSVAAFESSAK